MLTLIAALGLNRAIGHEGELPWHLPGDLRRFRTLTMGGNLIMGRRTYESIGRPLDGRKNIVMSRVSTIDHPQVLIAHDTDEALALATTPSTFVIGGEQIYRAFLTDADRIELTVVELRPEADAFFPPLAPNDWHCEGQRGGDGVPPHSFHTLVRRSGDQAPAECLGRLDP